MSAENWALIKSILPLLAPIFLIQVVLAVYCLVDVSKRLLLRGPRWLWIAGLILSAIAVPSGLFVSGLYLVWGRHVEGETI